MHYSAYDAYYIIVYNENHRCDAGVIKYYFVVDSRRIKWNSQAKYPKKTDKEGKIHRTSWFHFRFVQIDPEYCKEPNEDRSVTPSEIHCSDAVSWMPVTRLEVTLPSPEPKIKQITSM